MSPALTLSFALCWAASSASAAGIQAVRDPATGRPLGQAFAGQVLVKYRGSASALTRRASRDAVLARSAGEPSSAGWTLLDLSDGMTVEQALAHFGADPAVEAVAPNSVLRPLRVPNDPSFPDQYGLSVIGASAGWEYEIGESSTVTIAVVDTGIDRTHEDLSDQLHATALHRHFHCNTGAQVTAPSTDDDSVTGPQDTVLGHGTQVASVAAAEADNSRYLSGVAWKAKLLSLRVFTSTACGDIACGSGGCCPGECTSAAAVGKAIEYAVAVATSDPAVGRVVVNASLGESGSGSCNAAYVSSINSALANGVPVVAASGNTPGVGVFCPAKVPGVIGVGATDRSDVVADFTATGPELFLSAPGVGILVARPAADGGGITTNNGTSFASPHVAGVVALMLAAKPTLTTTQVRNLLQVSADDLGAEGRDDTYGYGRLNAFKALRATVKGSLSDLPSEQKAVAFPNPARLGAGSVTFAFPPAVQGSNLEIQVYTMSGERVRTLTGVTWDGKNDSGADVASGMYIFLVQTDRGKAKGRVAVLR